MSAMIRALEALRIAGEHEGAGAPIGAVLDRAAEYVDFVRAMEAEEDEPTEGAEIRIVGTSALDGLPVVDGDDLARDPDVRAAMEEVDEAIEAADAVIERVEGRLRKGKLN